MKRDRTDRETSPRQEPTEGASAAVSPLCPSQWSGLSPSSVSDHKEAESMANPNDYMPQVYEGNRYAMEEGACPACEGPLTLSAEDHNGATWYECLNPACKTEVNGRFAGLYQRTAAEVIV